MMKTILSNKSTLVGGSILLLAICTLVVPTSHLLWHHVFSACQSSCMYSEQSESVDYEELSLENINRLESGYVMLKTFRSTSSKIHPKARIHQSIILSKDIDYQFHLNFHSTYGRKVIFEMYTPQEPNLIHKFEFFSQQAQYNVKVPKTGLYIIRVYDESYSQELEGVLTIGGKSH